MAVNTNSYEWSHGKRPSGYGFWFFKVGQTEVSFSGMYSECKKKAIAFAKQIGACRIEVLS